MSVRRSLSWTVASQAVLFAVMFGSSMIVARLLTPVEMGINAIAMAANGVIQFIATFGISGYVIRERDLKPETLDLAFSVNAVLAGLISVTMLLTSLKAQVLLGDERAGHVLRILALGPICSIFSFRSSTMLQREMQFKPFALVSSGASITTSTVTVIFAATGASYMSAAYGGAIGAAVSAIGYNVVAPRHASLRITFQNWRVLARFGLQIMSISGVAILVTRFSDIIIGRVLGLAALGIYSRASMLTNLMFENIYGTTTRVAFSKLSKDYRELGEIRTSFLHALTMILALMWPLEICMAILSPPAINILYGAKWAAAALPLSILLVGQAITLSFGMNWELFVLRGETALQARLEVKRALFGFIIFVTLCRFGLGGAAIGRVADAGLGTIIYRKHLRRLSDVSNLELRQIYARSAVLTAAAALPPLCLMVIYRWSPVPPVPALVSAIILGVAIWGAMVILTRHALLGELVLMLKRINPGLGQAIQRYVEAKQ